MASRRISFECVYEQGRNEYRFLLRAGSAHEAQERLRAVLRDDGVREPGVLVVRSRKGRPLTRSSYEVAAR